MIALSGTFKRVNHATKQRDNPSSACTAGLLSANSRGTAQRPEGYASRDIEHDRKAERDPVAAGGVEHEASQPGAARGADAGADGDDAQDRAEVWAGKQIGCLGGNRGSPCAPGQAE